LMWNLLKVTMQKEKERVSRMGKISETREQRDNM
jgi:hypothetical protein